MPGPGLELFDDEEANEVADVICSRNLSRYRFDANPATQPSKTYMFERALEGYIQVRHCLGMNSCTSALLTGLWAAGIGSGDEVIVPGYTFIASIASIAYAGATPVLAEIDQSLTLDPSDVERKITSKTKAILAVHMLGAPCNMHALMALAKRYKLHLLEDCAQAGGARFHGRACGTFGAFGAFSLNVFKTFTAGDGGVFVTNDSELYQRAFAIHDHGSKPDRVGVAEADGLLGLNFRMHELTGAVARVQLTKLPKILTTLRHKKSQLAEAIGTLPHCSRRTINDVDGDCSTVLAYCYDDPEHASQVAASLGTITLDQSGKHNYARMSQLVGGKLPFGTFAGSYTPGVLPRTDSLLKRTLALSVGVVDSYLGTGIGINIHSTDADITRFAKAFRSAHLGIPRETLA